MVTPTGKHPGVPTVARHIPRGSHDRPCTLTGPVAAPPRSEKRGPPANPCQLKAPVETEGGEFAPVWAPAAVLTCT